MHRVFKAHGLGVHFFLASQLLLLTAAGMFSSGLTAAEKSEAPLDSTTSEVRALFPAIDLDIALVFRDKLGLPGGGKFSSSESTAPTDPISLAPIGSRALGLERARVGLSWINSRRSGVKLVLRPDYSSLAQGGGSQEKTANGAPVSTGVAREIDSRAGEVYSPAPSVKPLDAYSISLNTYENFGVELGVFEELLPRRAIYPEFLEFGLNVALPRKFSGAKVNWQLDRSIGAKDSTPVNEASTSTFQFMIVGLQGNDDRADSVKIGGKTYDAGPASNDPYAGGAAYIGWSPSPAFSSGILFGTGDHGFTRTLGSSLEPTTIKGKRSEAFTSLGATLSLGQQKKSRIGLDLRAAYDSFVLTEGKASPLNQRSVSITYSSPIKTALNGFIGVHSGTSQRHDLTNASKTVDVEGYQTDLGMLYAFDTNLEFALMAAWERRSNKASDGKRTGGFGSDSPENSIQRFGVRLNYFIPGS